MLGESNSTPVTKSVAKNPRFYSALVIGVISIYVGWIVLSRWHENTAIERRAAAERRAKQREQDQIAIEQLGGSELRILMFYASPATLGQGQTATICYGVANAKNVKLEGQDNLVWPSPNRCVDVKPTKDTTYTLTIDDGKGHSQSQAITIKVR
jgi:hypothetical protein